MFPHLAVAVAMAEGFCTATPPFLCLKLSVGWQEHWRLVSRIVGRTKAVSGQPSAKAGC